MSPDAGGHGSYRDENGSTHDVTHILFLPGAYPRRLSSIRGQKYCVRFLTKGVESHCDEYRKVTSPILPPLSTNRVRLVPAARSGTSATSRREPDWGPVAFWDRTCSWPRESRSATTTVSQNNVSLYEGVELEDDVFCGPSCVFTNVINPRSQIVRRGQYQRTVLRRGAI